MSDVSEKWSCPNCGALWSRDTQPLREWVVRLHSVQLAHGKRCPR